MSFDASYHVNNLSGLTFDFMNGRILLENPVGRGAYGYIYRGRDISRPKHEQTLYAVKCIEMPTPGTLRHTIFETELAILDMLGDHPNILTFHGAAYHSPHVFLLLDLCEGGDLFNAATRTDYFANEDAVRKTFLQILNAVQYCHSNGVYHRDLKPDNVLFSKHGHVYLADFGLSTMEPTTYITGVGTKAYMSPECLGEDILCVGFDNGPNDVWALGVLLLNILTCKMPWPRAAYHNVNYSAFRTNPSYLRDVLHTSAPLQRILLRVFDPNPTLRMGLTEFKQAMTEVPCLRRQNEPLETQRKEDLIREIQWRIMADAAAPILCTQPISEEHPAMRMNSDILYCRTSTMSETDVTSATDISNISASLRANQPSIALPPVPDHIVASEMSSPSLTPSDTSESTVEDTLVTTPQQPASNEIADVVSNMPDRPIISVGRVKITVSTPDDSALVTYAIATPALPPFPPVNMPSSSEMLNVSPALPSPPLATKTQSHPFFPMFHHHGTLRSAFHKLHTRIFG